MKLLNLTYKNFESLKKFIEDHGIQNAPSVLIQLFFSNRTPENAHTVRDELKTLLPGTPLIATSTAGIIAEGNLRDDTIILSFSCFDASQVTTCACNGETETIINKLTRSLITGRTRLLVIFANTFRFDSTTFLKHLSERFPHVVLAGGNAGDDYRFEGCAVFTSDHDDADVVVAAIDSDRLSVRTKYLLNWQSVGQSMRVTKAEGSTVYALNGKGILDVYDHYLGSDISGNILEYGIEFPLIYEKEGVPIARAAVAVDREAGSITFAGEIPEGEDVTFGYANIEHIETLNRTKLQETFQYQQEGIYIYSCGSRRQVLGSFLNDELGCINQVGPTSGFITYGEFFHDPKSCKNNLLNITTTYVVLNETEPSEPLHFRGKPVKRDRRDITLKALTTLIAKTSDDLDENIHYLEQFKGAVNEASIFSVTDDKGVITDINENFEAISGYTRDELIGSPHNIVRHPDMPKVVFKEMWETIQKGKTWHGLVKNRRKDGKAYHVLSQITPIYHKEGSFREYIAIREDVTELEEYKNLLKFELDATSKTLEGKVNYITQYEEAINATTAVLKTDTNNIIKYANTRFCELSGYTLDELVGMDCKMLRHEKHRNADECGQILEELKQKKVIRKILTNVAKDESEYILDTLFYPILGVGGEIIEYLQVMYDITEIYELNQEIEKTQKEVVLTMGAIGETRSKETGLHVKRVAEYSYLLARLAGLSDDEAKLLKQASPMHDIGKVGIPDSILNKPGKLTEEEFTIIQGHAEIGYEMLKHSERRILKASAVVAYTHHEKWNGSGYPRGLKGEEIPIFGRITAIADVFDALGHDRVYKKAWELDKILDLFKEERGRHFDPSLVDLFFENLNSFLAIRDQLQDNF